MNTDLQIFTNEQFGNVRVVDVDGDPWFVAADVCKAFGVANSRNVTERLTDDERGVSNVDTLGGTQRMTIVNEAGLYHMLFTMEPNNARGIDDAAVKMRIEALNQFKRWITHEVIPAIRKHGGYLTPDKLEEALMNPDVLIRLATDLKAERKLRIAAQQENAALIPKAEFYDAVADSTSTIEMATVAKVLNLGIGRTKLFEILRNNKILRCDNTPLQKYIDLGWFRCVESKYTKPGGGTFINIKTVVYQKGIDGILKLLNGLTKQEGLTFDT